MSDNAMKYVIYKLPNLGGEIPLIFPSIMDHNKVMHQMAVVSAGFCYISGNQGNGSGEVNVTCFGRSETLKKDCRDGDGLLIEKFLNQHHNPI